MLPYTRKLRMDCAYSMQAGISKHMNPSKLPGTPRQARSVSCTAVVYLHITRGNYQGAVKVYRRSQRWMQDWPEVCRGIQVEELRRNAAAAMVAVENLGESNISRFDLSLLKPISWSEKRIYFCDRCGHEMYEKNCKVTCPNCGNRFDCSDLNIYFD
jgi:rubrerythrin